MPKKGKKGGGGAKKTAREDVGLPSELEEDVDKYVEGRNKIMMGRDDEDQDEDEDMEGLDGGQGQVIVGLGDEADDDDEDDDSYDDSDDAGVTREGLREGIESDEEEKGEEGWGKKKGDYYDVDEMEDSEAEEEEEKEVMRIRARQSEALRSADFGEDEVESDEGEDTLGVRTWVSCIPCMARVSYSPVYVLLHVAVNVPSIPCPCCLVLGLAKHICVYPVACLALGLPPSHLVIISIMTS